VTLVSHSWAGLGQFEDRGERFGLFVRALAARVAEVAPGARIGTAELSSHGALIWTIGLLGAGVVALLLLSLTAGAAGLGLSLAARMLFVLILLLAVLPWLKPTAPKLDPLNLPRSLVP
jgi:hypothetical protein